MVFKLFLRQAGFERTLFSDALLEKLLPQDMILTLIWHRNTYQRGYAHYHRRYCRSIWRFCCVANNSGFLQLIRRARKVGKNIEKAN